MSFLVRLETVFDREVAVNPVENTKFIRDFPSFVRTNFQNLELVIFLLI